MKKVIEWIHRYLPAHIISKFTAISAAWVAYSLTNNLIISAYAGSIGDYLGYYSTVITEDVIKTVKKHKKYTFKLLIRTIRNYLVEFGVGEALDTYITRPFFMYILPIITGNYLLGIFIATYVADIVFYIPTILGYEIRKKYLKDHT